MQTLRETVTQVLKDLKNRQIDTRPKIFEAFEDKLSRQERAHIKCVSFLKGTLTVKVDSSVWLYQLSQKKEELEGQLGLNRLNLCITDIVADEKKKRNKKQKGRTKKH